MAGRFQSARPLVRVVLDVVPPASGAAVMGTGIVSVALALDGRQVLSRVLLVLAALAWIALGALLAARALGDLERVCSDARTPAALSGVAGTAVLGTRLVMLGWEWAAVVLLAIAAASWLALLVPVLTRWATPTTGASLLLAVATESLSVLAAALAARDHDRWLLDAALAPLAIGLVLYVFVMLRFDRRALARSEGEHWITGGALAISALAAGQVALAAHELATLGAIHRVLVDGSAVLWALAIAWLPVLAAGEVLRPRLRYGVSRWSTVFPVGMYAACSFTVASAATAPGIGDFARVWVWPAVVLWFVVAVAALRHGLWIAGGRAAH